MDDVAVGLEHVDLLNGLDGLHVHLLEGGLQFLIVGARVLVNLLDLPAGSTLAAMESLSVHASYYTADCCLAHSSGCAQSRELLVDFGWSCEMPQPLKGW